MSLSMLNILFVLCGGLAVFIYGMNLMGEGLQKSAGERTRRILETLTSNPVVAVLIGALIACILQSSSATTVMVVGFVSARLMTLTQAISVIMGANIGTTVTAQLIAFDIGRYAYPIAALGFIFFYFSRKKTIKYIGQTVFGFGLLFIGLNTMSDAMKSLANHIDFQNMISELNHMPVLGLLIGILTTVVVQSSNATIAMLQKLASQPIDQSGQALISIQSALPILFGDNIGITIAAILASIGARINAKRAAFAHAVFNILGVLVFIWLIPVFAEFIRLISPKGPEYQVVARQIANAHTAFNVLNTLIWFPFIWLLEKIVTFLVQGEEEVIDPRVLYLDDRMLDKPSIAMDLATKELARMATFAHQMMKSARNAFANSNMEEAQQVVETEDMVDMLQREITRYLSTMLSQCELTERQSIRLVGLMHTASDIERIGDHCKNIAEFAQQKETEFVPFSEDALAEIKDAFDHLNKMVHDTIRALHDGNTELAKKVLSEENEVDQLEHYLRARHIDRLNQGQCNPQATITFIELIHNLERIADHCNNIAEAVLDDYSVGPYDRGE